MYGGGTGRGHMFFDVACARGLKSQACSRMPRPEKRKRTSKAGAPRTMFKPDDGAAYWEKQKDRESHAQSSRSARRSSRNSDDAA